MASTTILWLELQAAVTALRLGKVIRKELSMSIGKTYFSSDSTAVLLSVYNNKRRFTVFVANRLAEIERYSNPESRSYVFSDLNPADKVLQGVLAQRLMSFTWIHGPKFFYRLFEELPELLRNCHCCQKTFLHSKKS